MPVTPNTIGPKSMSFSTAVRYMEAAGAPMVARISKLALMFDVTEKNIRECIRDNAIQPVGVGGSGPRYCTLEIWDAIFKTQGKPFPQKGGNREGKHG